MIKQTISIKNFPDNFTDLFLNTNLTKHQFAKEVGIDHYQITCYLQGTILLLEVLLKFAITLIVPLTIC